MDGDGSGRRGDGERERWFMNEIGRDSGGGDGGVLGGFDGRLAVAILAVIGSTRP